MTDILSVLNEKGLIKGIDDKELENSMNHSRVFLVNEAAEKLVLKEIKQPWLTEVKLNKQGTFANKMRQQMGGFVKVVQFPDGNYFFKHGEKIYTLESFCEGIEEKEYTRENCVDLASFLGKIHAVSDRFQLKFGYDGPWSVDFEHNCADDLQSEKEEYFNYFIDSLKELNYDTELITQVTTFFNQKITQLKEELRLLPKGAVQGDLSLENVRFNEQHEVVGIFDYNICGDEVYIWDFINQIAWYLQNTSHQINLTPIMLEAYVQQRPISEQEKAMVMKWVNFTYYTRYSIYMEFRYYARQGEHEKVHHYLKAFLSS